MGGKTVLDGVMRLIRPGNKNNDVTKKIQELCTTFEITAVEGVLSHKVKKHLIDGNDTIITKETIEHKVKEHELEVGEVYVLDIIVTTGEGKPKEVSLNLFSFF